MQAWKLAVSLAAVLAAAPAGPPARAEVKEVILGQQFGAVYLNMMVMQHHQLVEKQLAAAGMGDVKVTWAKLGGPAALNDAMISGNLHFSSQGVPSLAVIWDRTRSGVGVKAVWSAATNNIWLNTRNPAIKSLKDFTEKDRIGIPSLKVSTQALMLHIGAEKIFGSGKFAALDHITVPMPHPDATAALLNPGHEINTHFATSPFHEVEKKNGARTVTTAFEIMGGPMTGLVWATTTRFRSENPKVYAAVNKAYDAGLAWIAADQRRAAELYIAISKEKRMTAEDMIGAFAAGDLSFTKTPQKVGTMVAFMHRNGLVKTAPASWKDLFFPEAHELPGS